MIKIAFIFHFLLQISAKLSDGSEIYCRMSSSKQVKVLNMFFCSYKNLCF